jgi:2-deoxy-D-gluconate 3-dehydrogenase
VNATAAALAPNFDLTGQTALVTGAARGIGLAIAAALAHAGADIVGASSTIAQSDGELRAAVSAAGTHYFPVTLDLADRDSVASLAGRLEGRDVDILVNNGGIIRRTPAIDHSLDDWDDVLEIDLRAQFALTQSLARPMIERGRGRILFIASMLSFQGGVNVPGYTAAKHGVLGLTRALSNEWARHGITVNAIAPGYIETDATSALRDDPARAAGILGRIPLQRWGRPDDLAGAAVFLASPSAAYVTGAVLPVDGGWLAS